MVRISKFTYCDIHITFQTKCTRQSVFESLDDCALSAPSPQYNYAHYIPRPRFIVPSFNRALVLPRLRYTAPSLYRASDIPRPRQYAAPSIYQALAKRRPHFIPPLLYRTLAVPGPYYNMASLYRASAKLSLARFWEIFCSLLAFRQEEF